MCAKSQGGECGFGFGTCAPGFKCVYGDSQEHISDPRGTCQSKADWNCIVELLLTILMCMWRRLPIPAAQESSQLSQRDNLGSFPWESYEDQELKIMERRGKEMIWLMQIIFWKMTLLLKIDIYMIYIKH